MIEADFCQFYGGADLRDFWRAGSGMTYRWVVSHIRHLPEDSRYVKHILAEEGHIWRQPDHHRQDVVDLLQQAVYFLTYAATADFKQYDKAKVIKGAPKPATRPGQKQEKPQMSSKEELNTFFSAFG